MAQTKNVRLKKAIKKHFGSTAKLCRTWPDCKGKQQTISDLINIKKSPWRLDGAFRSVCITLSEALGILPEKLFPPEFYKDVMPHGVEITAICPVSNQTMKKLRKIASADDPITEAEVEQLRGRIAKVLKTLSYREREIIKLRYGLGDGGSYTLEEVGNVFRVTRKIIRQIEAKATRKLQQPSRSQELVDFLD